MQEYHPRAYKDAHTITLKTRQKDDYTTPKAWSPIALLNTTGKVFESVMAAKMSYLTERHRLIPDTQMGGRGGKSTETARELLTEQVHTVWGQGQDRVATLLSIDVAGAFDTVSHRRLLHNLKTRKIPGWMAKWVGSFLEDRHTTLAINHRATESFKVTTGIPQCSPISPILYLYYNADLLDICERPGEPTSAFGFIDDINILAYGTSTEGNIEVPERLHSKCERWARRHGSTFAPKKYEIIHLARNTKKFNMAATITIDGETRTPKADIRVLGVQIDTKLKWGPHIKKIQNRMVTQTQALTKITVSTWRASFLRARHVYLAVIRPAMTYGLTAWHARLDIKDARKSVVEKLAVIQNRCLRAVAGAYKATPIEVLHAETMIMPVQEQFDMF